MQDMTVLITGGAGFIGSLVAETILEQGHKVLVIDDLSTGRFSNISHLLKNSKFHFARASVRDEIVLDRLASKSQVIIHLAAAVGVDLIMKNPVHTLETNIMGTEAVLKTALRYGCKVLLASTSEVYGKGNSFPFGEDDDVLLGPTNKSRWAYAASKMVDEFLGLAYYAEHDLPVIPFRMFNTVGPRQTGHYGMVIPRLMHQALKGEPLTVYGDGTQRRCFCDVYDVVQALVGLMSHPDAPGTLFNIGSEEEISIINLAEKIKKITKSSSNIILIPYSKAYAPGFEDMERRVPSTNRIRNLIGWKPTLSLDDTLIRVKDDLIANPE